MTQGNCCRMAIITLLTRLFRNSPPGPGLPWLPPVPPCPPARNKVSLPAPSPSPGLQKQADGAMALSAASPGEGPRWLALCLLRSLCRTPCLIGVVAGEIKDSQTLVPSLSSHQIFHWLSEKAGKHQMHPFFKKSASTVL